MTNILTCHIRQLSLDDTAVLLFSYLDIFLVWSALSWLLLNISLMDSRKVFWLQCLKKLFRRISTIPLVPSPKRHCAIEHPSWKQHPIKRWLSPADKFIKLSYSEMDFDLNHLLALSHDLFFIFFSNLPYLDLSRILKQWDSIWQSIRMSNKNVCSCWPVVIEE